MARKNSRGLELSFHKASKRWRKMINGKHVYFAKGPAVHTLEQVGEVYNSDKP